MNWQGKPPAPVRTICALGMIAYGSLLAGWSDHFTATLYDPAQNLMPLPIWGVALVVCAVTALIGIHKGHLTSRFATGMPLAFVMLTWWALQVTSVFVDGFNGASLPGAIPLGATINGMYLAAFLNDRRE